ncbi:MAG: universal stress protein [Acidimicrobiia bacterium]
MKTILVATDLGPSSSRVVAAAAELGALGHPIVPVHVLTPERVNDYRQSLPDDSAFVDVLQSRLAGDVEDQFRGIDNVSAPVILMGDPASMLIERAGEVEAAYLVIGIRNRSKVGKLLMGSAAQEILLNAPCPVVGVPI